MLEEILAGGFKDLGLPIPEGAAEKFRGFYELLDEKNKVMNLTAIYGEEDTARLHFLDCAALLGMAEFAGRSVIDVGTGAGFPGVPLLISRPDLSVTLLDSQQKRTLFLKEVCEKLGLPARVVWARAEEAAQELRGSFDIAVSRAVARLNVLCELCLPFVRTGGLFIAMKGPDCAQELSEAHNAVSLLGAKVADVRSYTVPGTAAVHSAVIIEKTGQTPAKYPRRFAKIQKNPL